MLKGTRHIDNNRVVGRTAEAASNLVTTYLDEVQWDTLDRSQLPLWIDLLREGEQGLRQLRLRLEALDAGQDRRCAVCGEPITGRADRAYCGATCRQRARRQSHLEQ